MRVSHEGFPRRYEHANASWVVGAVVCVSSYIAVLDTIELGNRTSVAAPEARDNNTTGR